MANEYLLIGAEAMGEFFDDIYRPVLASGTAYGNGQRSPIVADIKGQPTQQE